MSAPLKVGIVGLGAIGGHFAVRLARAGAQVSALARGATLAALRDAPLRVVQGGETLEAKIAVADDPEALGAQDVVIVAVKGPALASVAPAVAALCGPETAVVPAMNGVPWWFFHGFGGVLEGASLATIDPDGGIAKAIPPRRVVGSVVHLSCSVASPGVVRHGMGNRVIFGEPAGGASKRLHLVAEAFRAGGFDVELAPRIQVEVWYTSCGAQTMNPVTAFTGATADLVLDDPLVNRFCNDVMVEAAAIGAAIGAPIAQSPEDRNAVTRKLGAMRTSMLQDVEAGRPVEIDALLSAPREIAQRVGLATPRLDALLGLARLHARVHGLYPPAQATP